MTNTFETKIGKDGTRIWLEGARLQEAGFKKGDAVKREWSKGKLVLIKSKAKDIASLDRHERGSVAGMTDRPIIDITSARVAETFKGTHVKVTYSPGRIVIVNA